MFPFWLFQERKVVKCSSATEIVVGGTSSQLLSVIPSFSRHWRKVCLRGFWKQWWNGNSFFHVSSRLLFCSSEETALFAFSSQFLSPVSFPWLYQLFAFYIAHLSYLSSFFSSLLCPDSPVPGCLTIILVLPFSLHTKPVDLTYIARATGFAL